MLIYNIILWGRLYLSHMHDLFYTIYKMKPVPTTIQLFPLNGVSNTAEVTSYSLLTLVYAVSVKVVL